MEFLCNFLLWFDNLTSSPAQVRDVGREAISTVSRRTFLTKSPGCVGNFQKELGLCASSTPPPKWLASVTAVLTKSSGVPTVVTIPLRQKNT